MEFGYPPSAVALQDEVRSFLAERPVESYSHDAMDGGYGTGAYSFEFMRALGERGWVSLTWPRRFGGAERPMIDQLAMLEELALAGAPFGPLVGSDQWAQSLIRDTDNPQLRDELLPRIAAGEALGVAGLQRARRRLGSPGPRHQGSPRWRRVRDQREARPGAPKPGRAPTAWCSPAPRAQTTRAAGPAG